MPLLAGVLLRDLQFNRLAGLLKNGEERRGRLAHLKIDWPVFDLDYDVVLKRAIEWTKVVKGNALRNPP